MLLSVQLNYLISINIGVGRLNYLNCNRICRPFTECNRISDASLADCSLSDRVMEDERDYATTAATSRTRGLTSLWCCLL